MATALVILGLLFSIAAFGRALFELRKMVKKHKIHPTISEEKFVVIRNTFASMVVATALLYVTLLGAGGFAYLKGESVNDSLCALRSDLQVRVDSSEEFLEEHPNGIQGISRADIQQGIDNQERTIEALDDLSC